MLLRIYDGMSEKKRDEGSGSERKLVKRVSPNVQLWEDNFYFYFFCKSTQKNGLLGWRTLHLPRQDSSDAPSHTEGCTQTSVTRACTIERTPRCWKQPPPPLPRCCFCFLAASCRRQPSLLISRSPASPFLASRTVSVKSVCVCARVGELILLPLKAEDGK